MIRSTTFLISKADREALLRRFPDQPLPDNVSGVRSLAIAGVLTFVFMGAAFIVGPRNPPDWVIALILVPLLVCAVVTLALLVFVLPATVTSLLPKQEERAAAAEIPEEGVQHAATASEGWLIVFEEDAFGIIALRTGDDYIVLHNAPELEIVDESADTPTIPSVITVRLIEDWGNIIEIRTEGEPIALTHVDITDTATGFEDWITTECCTYTAFSLPESLRAAISP